MASFREFLNEGKIGDISLGMTAQTVEGFIGRAEDRSVKTRPVEIRKFGSIELAFKYVPEIRASCLIAIAVYFFDPKRHLPPTVAFEDWTPTLQTTEAEFRGFLESAGLHAHSKVDGEQTTLILDSGASVVFDEDHLHSVHFRRADRPPQRRQMSVSLPESTLSQLRARAQREKIPLQKLIEKMLSTTV